MGNVSLRGIKKSYGDTDVIHGIDLEVADGEFVVFVGPSGCGKSSMLRMIAGLEEISDGELHIGRKLANDLPPAERGAAMVFQNYALYPHMTVADNMGFALKISGVPKQDVKTAVEGAASALRISHLLGRKPKALSGGERQRVAIGRAIVRKPKVFLFDEPLSNLDAALRVQMRLELSRLHRELKNTMIYVTHDQVEAMTMGQRIVVFNQGRIEQLGTPLELYHRPANLFVAGFLGAPKMNFISCTAVHQTPAMTLRFEHGGTLDFPLRAHASLIGKQLTLGVRPEQLEVVAPGKGLAARVEQYEHLGDATIMYAKLVGGEQSLAVKVHGAQRVAEPGELVGLLPPASHTMLFDSAGKAIELH